MSWKPRAVPLMLAAMSVTAAVADAQTAGDRQCCFHNVRYAGACRVELEPGAECDEVLAYLNSATSVGRTYCGATDVRHGWTRVPCEDDAEAAASAGDGTEVPVRTGPPTGKRAGGDVAKGVPPGGEPPGAEPPGGEPGIDPPAGVAAGGEPPEAGDPFPVTPPEPVVLSPPAPTEVGRDDDPAGINVRIEERVEPDTFAPGGEFTARLTEPLTDVEGATLAPRGSLVFGTVERDDDGRSRLVLTNVLVDDEVLPLEGSGGLAPGDVARLEPGTEVAAPLGGVGAPSPELSALQYAIRRWRAAFVVGNADAAADFFASDAVLTLPGGSRATGRDAIRDALDGHFDQRGGSVEVEEVDVGLEGDLGFAAADYRIVGDDGSPVASGQVLEVWREIDGRWRIERASWSSDPRD